MTTGDMLSEGSFFLQTLPFYITNNIVRSINRQFKCTSKSKFLIHKRLAMHRWTLMLFFHFIAGEKLLLLLFHFIAGEKLLLLLLFFHFIPR